MTTFYFKSIESAEISAKNDFNSNYSITKSECSCECGESVCIRIYNEDAVEVAKYVVCEACYNNCHNIEKGENVMNEREAK